MALVDELLGAGHADFGELGKGGLDLFGGELLHVVGLEGVVDAVDEGDGGFEGGAAALTGDDLELCEC